MDNAILILQLVFIVAMYVLIMNQVIKLYNKYKEDSASSITETTDEEGNLTVIEKRNYL